jgi:hypothetical protein
MFMLRLPAVVASLDDELMVASPVTPARVTAS